MMMGQTKEFFNSLLYSLSNWVQPRDTLIFIIESVYISPNLELLSPDRSGSEK